MNAGISTDGPAPPHAARRVRTAVRIIFMAVTAALLWLAGAVISPAVSW